MGHYRVLTRLRRDGREHPVGEVVNLPPDEALPLVHVGVLVAEETTPPVVTVGRGRRRTKI